MAKFVLLTDDELENFLDCDSVNTKKLTKYAVNRLEAFVKCVGLNSLEDVDNLKADELDKLLSRFYAGSRKDDGTLYTKKSIQSIKYGIHKYFLAKGIDTNAENFRESQQSFKAMSQKLKREGKGFVKHKNPVTKEDMIKINESGLVDIDAPSGLQNKVFLDVMVYFGQRGRESLRDMRSDDYELKEDEEGRYFERRDTLTKSRRENEDEEYGGRMYEIKDSPRCPVSSLLKYKALLNPSCMSFWQRPKSKAPLQEGPWYDKVPVGINTLGNKVKEITEAAGCGGKYSNHSLRATTITTLNDAGFESRDIMTVTGHKSESSLKHYARTSAQKKKEMSRKIAKSLAQNGAGDEDSHEGNVAAAILDLQQEMQVHAGGDDEAQKMNLALSQELNIRASSSSTTTNNSNIQNFHFHGPVTFINK